MKFISWNVNGLRACMGKGFMDFFNEIDADIFCLQETKLSEGQIELDTPGYHQYWNYAEKKGYSGTAVFTKKEPISVTYGIGIEEHDHEGRVITAEFDDFYFVDVYVPNSQRELTRLDYRMVWEDAFLLYVKKLDEKLDIHDFRLVHYGKKDRKISFDVSVPYGFKLKDDEIIKYIKNTICAAKYDVDLDITIDKESK